MSPPVIWRLHLPLPPQEVYAALDSDSGRASFWAESAEEQDGKITFRFIDGTQRQEALVERTPPVRWSVSYFGGTAQFEFLPAAQGGTDLTLTHSGIAPREWNEVHAGWLNVLLPLKAWLVHGVDLRNHDPDRTWSDGYVDQ